MFVYTMKASSIKFFSVIALSIAVLAAMVAILPLIAASSDAAEVAADYKTGDSVGEIRDFLSGYGYETEETPEKTLKIEIPSEFNSIYEKYNDIQRAQGLNLRRYAGKKADVFVFRIKNYENRKDVFATVITRSGRIIGGDICSNEENGFVHGFRKP